MLYFLIISKSYSFLASRKNMIQTKKGIPEDRIFLFHYDDPDEDKNGNEKKLVEYDKLYPEFQFAKNKGYGTKDHVEALKKYGPTPIHRRSFIKNYVE